MSIHPPVSGPAPTAAERSVHPRVGLAAARGAAVGFLLVAPAFTILGLLVGAGAAGAVGLGLFVGIWGGCGWGGMLAASMHLTRAERPVQVLGPVPAPPRPTAGDHGPIAG